RRAFPAPPRCPHDPSAQWRRRAHVRTRRAVRRAGRCLSRTVWSITMNARTIPVVIIGAGPTGLTAASLLGRHGVKCVVLERWPSVYPQPRAVHLDDEVYRILGMVGLAEQFDAISWPCHGLRLVDRSMRILAEFRRHTGRGRHGYPEANLFDQPELEGLLRTNLRRYDTVTLRSNVEVTALTQHGSGPVRVDLIDRVSGQPETVHAEYVLGCDGANSLTRTAIGSTIRDLGFEQGWLGVHSRTP